MIFISGDLHGEIDVHKLNNRQFPLSRHLTKTDYLIITGDFGFVRDNGKTDVYWLEWLDKKPYTTLFVDGNHENFNLLNAYPVVEWNCGLVHKIKASVLHLMRGQLFSLCGKTFFTFGGAHSTDKAHRTENKNWWQEECPSAYELEQGKSVLERAGWQVDYIITHTCPASVLPEITGVPAACKQPAEINVYFEMINQKTVFRHWYFGHFHQDAEIDKQHTVVYNKILQIL